jgi:DHA1 family bicyclomycin/chloramphenicol resistance-like MFS transporter
MSNTSVVSGNPSQKKIKFESIMYIICGCILSMGAIHMDTINWILPQVAETLGSGNNTLMVTSGFFYGMMIGHVVVGPLSDMIGKKKTMILGFVICIVGAVIGGTSGSLGGLVAARLIQGIGGAAASNAARSIGGDAGKGKKSAIALTFMQIWSGALPIILPLSGKWVGNSFGWHAIFWLQAIMCGVLCILVLVFVTETSELAGKGSVKRIAAEAKSCLATPEYVAFVLCFAFNMALFFCYAGSASFAMVTELGMNNNAYANMYAINAATMVVSAAIGRALAARVSPAKIVRILNVAQFAVAVFISVSYMRGTADYHWLQFVWWVFPFIQGMTLPTAMSLVMNASGKATGTGAAVMGFVQYLFSSITTTMLANIKESGSIGSVIGWIMAACAVLSIITCTIGAFFLKKKDASALE